MSLPVTIADKGHSVHLKWHRARRFATDPVFTGTRILEGLRAGASVEVDIVLDATDGMVILHNEVLSEETTGRGLVRETSPDVLRQLHLRGNDGTPLDERVMLLDDLVVLLDGGEIHPDALLQLDLKENLAALSPRAARRFRETLQPVARHVVLSGGDAAAVRLLARDLPGLIERSGGNPAKAAARKGPDPDEAFYAAIADWRTSPVLTERERMAAEYADRLGQSPKSMEEDDGFWQQMHAVFSDAEIVDLSFAIAMWMGFGRLTHALELDNVSMPTALS